MAAILKFLGWRGIAAVAGIGILLAGAFANMVVMRDRER